MRNLALVIDDNTIANDRVVECTTVDRGTGPNLHAIANNNATKLRDLNPVTAIVRVTKAIRTNHGAGLDEAIFADFNFMINGHIGP